MWHAANMLCGCRTAALGGHIVSCPNGHQHRIAYNSCRHRSCPQCALLPREKWLHGWRTRLLDCPHYHVVFTTPHELNSLWRYNRKRFAEALFAAATGALTKLLADEKYLGARPGLLAALHTWSQTLAAHVHLHVLVTAGGLDTSGRWRQVVKPCLLPRKVLMIIFRGKLRAELLDALDRGELQLPPDMSETQARGLLNKLGRTVWNVKILDRYDHGVGVVTYLARYLKGGPISPTRFISVTPDRVRFRCRSTTGEGGSGGGDVRLKMDDFLCRLLNHVPPRSMQTVRGYGLYAGCKRELLNDARECLGQARLPSEPPVAPTWQELCITLGLGSKARCEQCGEELVVHGHFKRGRAPPSCQLRESVGL
jgi:hypothetical protein